MCDPFPRRSLAEETPPLESESAEDGSPRPAAVVDSRPGRDLTDARTYTKHPHRLYSELAEIRRVLAPRGLFLLHDWTRQRARHHSILHLGRPAHRRDSAMSASYSPEQRALILARYRGAGLLPSLLDRWGHEF